MSGKTGAQQCCKRVYSRDSWHSWQCHHPAKVIVDGKPYCGVHDPNKRRAKSQVESENKYVAFERRAASLVRRLAREGHEEAKALVDELEGGI